MDKLRASWRLTPTSGNGLSYGGLLIGRVKLSVFDSDLGRSEYYIGERYAEFDGIAVFSWTTDIARKFFLGTRFAGTRENVEILRTFEHHGGTIVDFFDDILSSDGLAEFHSPLRELHVPLPPNFSLPATPATSEQASNTISGAGSSNPHDGRRPATAIASRFRAEPLLLQRLVAPRKVGLSSALATLQPGQFDLITRPAMDSQLIEGPPGSGKTIVATHRAAYMVGAEPENSLDGDVLLVGPTIGYVHHARSALHELCNARSLGRITVESVAGLLRRIVGSTSMPAGEISTCWQDADTQLGRFIDAIVLAQPRNGVRDPVRIYDLLRRNKLSERRRIPLTRDRDWVEYLRHLPSWYRARRERRLLPLVGYITWSTAIDPPVGLRRIEHIIVDECQDLTGLELLLLRRINAARAWTLIGDLNQRRSDHTLSQWSQIVSLLEPYDEPSVARLSHAYRSTRPIIEYASRLIPRDQRVSAPVQTAGSAPKVIFCARDDLPRIAVDCVGDLLKTDSQRTVALIASRLEGRSLLMQLRMSGWSESPGSALPLWRRGPSSFVAMHHEMARGLEFDAVVVVEPSSFPKNYGRHGPLYTALTRANRELIVVHSKQLPAQLR